MVVRSKRRSRFFSSYIPLTTSRGSSLLMARDFLGLELFVRREVRSFRYFTTVYCLSFFGATTVNAVVYLWFTLCAKYIIAINDVLLRMFVGSFFGLSGGVGAAAGSNLGIAHSAHVARRQVLAGDKNLHKIVTIGRRLQTTTQNGQSSAVTSTLSLLNFRTSV